MGESLQVWHLVVAIGLLLIGIAGLLQNNATVNRTKHTELEKRIGRQADKQAAHEKEVAREYARRSEVTAQIERLEKHLTDKLNLILKAVSND